MRLRKADIRRRVNSNLELRFVSTGLTSYAGLELVRRYFRSLGLAQRLRRHLGGGDPGYRLRGRSYGARGAHTAA